MGVKNGDLPLQKVKSQIIQIQVAGSYGWRGLFTAMIMA